jgi:hypothetical protein
VNRTVPGPCAVAGATPASVTPAGAALAAPAKESDPASINRQTLDTPAKWQGLIFAFSRKYAVTEIYWQMTIASNPC